MVSLKESWLCRGSALLRGGGYHTQLAPVGEGPGPFLSEGGAPFGEERPRPAPCSLPIVKRIRISMALAYRHVGDAMLIAAIGFIAAIIAGAF